MLKYNVENKIKSHCVEKKNHYILRKKKTEMSRINAFNQCHVHCILIEDMTQLDHIVKPYIRLSSKNKALYMMHMR